MVFFNYSTMQMAAKVVYYGPGLCGKTTNLQWIFEHTSTESRGEMVSLATETDRTLFFDLLPIDVGSIAGFSTRIQLYTVPGQVFYNTTRKLVLKGVDGVVFVADSQRPMLQANAESFQNLEENLAEMGLSLDNIPVVLQYNKQDLPGICSFDEMDQALNRQNWPAMRASALNGDGVFETLKMISKATLLALKKRLTKSRPEGTLAGSAKRPMSPVVRPPNQQRPVSSVKRPSPSASAPAPATAKPAKMETATSGPSKPTATLPHSTATTDSQVLSNLDLEPPALEVAEPLSGPSLTDSQTSREIVPGAAVSGDEPQSPVHSETTPSTDPEMDLVDAALTPQAEAATTPQQQEAATLEDTNTAPPQPAASTKPEALAPEAGHEVDATNETRLSERAEEETAQPVARKPDLTASPMSPPRKTRHRSSGFDALEELEKLRRQTVDVKAVTRSNGKHEINRDIKMKLNRADFSRAQRVSLTLQIEDSERQIVDEARHLHIDIEEAGSLEEFLLRLNIALHSSP